MCVLSALGTSPRPQVWSLILAGAGLAQDTENLGDPEGCAGALGEASSDGISG